MAYKRLFIACVFFAFRAMPLFPAECTSTPTHEINLYSGSNTSLLSPDRQWKLVTVGPNSEGKAALYILNTSSSKRWTFGWIERDGTAFWSYDSKRLFLRDEYAADDTRIRVFEVTGRIPKEIEGLNGRIQQAIFSHIPSNKTTQWLYFPKVCFAADDSSTIVLVADAPLVPKRESGGGKPFRLRLTVNLTTLQIVTTNNVEQRDDSTENPS
jgi:hypothetical protein